MTWTSSWRATPKRSSESVTGAPTAWTSGRQAGRLHRCGRTPPGPCHPGVAGRGTDRVPAQRPALCGQPPQPVRGDRYDHSSPRTSRPRLGCSQRAAAFRGLRALERPTDPGAVSRPGSECSTTTYRGPERSRSPRFGGDAGRRQPSRDQRVVIFGSGTAGIGIADQIRR